VWLNGLSKQAEYVRDGFKSQPQRCIKKWYQSHYHMAHIIVQIYEIQTPAEAQLMIALGADHVGTVLLDQKDLKISALRETIATVAASPARSSLIPLFNQAPRVMEALEYYRPNIVHFCENLQNGSGNDDYISKLVDLQQKVKRFFPDIQIMRSIPIPRADAHAVCHWKSLAQRFESTSDYFLTDTLLGSDTHASDQEQPVNGFVGITGQTCDWNIADQLVKHSRIPVILAGGISPENVCAGIEQVHPAGVDSCTLTNAVDENGVPIRFQKDPIRVKALVQAVRDWEKQHRFDSQTEL
jgi:phosphoribosylanthranilate isomerase